MGIEIHLPKSIQNLRNAKAGAECWKTGASRATKGRQQHQAHLIVGHIRFTELNFWKQLLLCSASKTYFKYEKGGRSEEHMVADAWGKAGAA